MRSLAHALTSSRTLWLASGLLLLWACAESESALEPGPGSGGSGASGGSAGAGTGGSGTGGSGTAGSGTAGTLGKGGSAGSSNAFGGSAGTAGSGGSAGGSAGSAGSSGSAGSAGSGGTAGGSAGSGGAGGSVLSGGAGGSAGSAGTAGTGPIGDGGMGSVGDCTEGNEDETLAHSDAYSGSANVCLRLTHTSGWSNVKPQLQVSSGDYPIHYEYQNCEEGGSGDITANGSYFMLGAGPSTSVPNPECDIYVLLSGSGDVSLVHYD